jgi:hypothetical protein
MTPLSRHCHRTALGGGAVAIVDQHAGCLPCKRASRVLAVSRDEKAAALLCEPITGILAANPGAYSAPQKR